MTPSKTFHCVGNILIIHNISNP